MQRLITILSLFKEYVVCAFLLVISLLLLSNNDNRQIHALRAYTIGFIGAVQNVLSVIPNVVELKRENQILRQLNVNLSDEVNRLREARLENTRLRAMVGLKEKNEFPLLPAEVIGKSLYLLRNTITLNVGEQEGVNIDMPVISEFGLVGKIIAVSSHYSVGQLLVNKDFRASAKIQRSRVDGIIAWEGGESLRLKNISKKQDVVVGDVATTSEYSSIFPDNIKIGVVARVTEHAGNLFKEVEIIPSVDFSSLEQVFIITAVQDTERAVLESKIVHSK